MLRSLLFLTLLGFASAAEAAQFFDISLNSNQLEYGDESSVRGYGLGLEYNYLFNISDVVYLGAGLRYSGDQYDLKDDQDLTTSNLSALLKLAIPANSVLIPYVDLNLVLPFASAATEDNSSTERDFEGTESGVDLKIGCLIRVSQSWAFNFNAVLASNRTITYTPSENTEISHSSSGPFKYQEPSLRA